MKLTKENAFCGTLHIACCQKTKARKAAFEEALEVRTQFAMKLADELRIKLIATSVTQSYQLIDSSIDGTTLSIIQDH